MYRAIILIAITFCTTKTALAQSLRFTDTSNKWHVAAMLVNKDYNYRDSPSWYNYREFYSGDTIIDGLLYQKLFRQMGSGRLEMKPVRESNNIVYTYSGKRNKDVILFDLSKKYKIGDTIFIFRSDADEYELNTVYGTDSNLINSIWHYGYLLKGDTSYYNLMQGIGTTMGTFWNYKRGIVYTQITVSCFENNGARPDIPFIYYWLPRPYDPTPCVWQPMPSAVDEHYGLKQDIKIYPQPAQDVVTIVLPTITNGKLKVINTTGVLVHQQPIIATSEVTIKTALMPGLYFYNITNDNNNINYKGKLLYGH